MGSATPPLYQNEAAAPALAVAAYPAMAEGRAFKSEVLMKRRDGTSFWAHLTGKLVNPADPSEGSIWIIDDIDDQKTAQAQLQSVLTEQCLSLDNAMVVIVVLRNRIATRCNQRLESMLGDEPGECTESRHASGT